MTTMTKMTKTVLDDDGDDDDDSFFLSIHVNVEKIDINHKRDGLYRKAVIITKKKKKKKKKKNK